MMSRWSSASSTSDRTRSACTSRAAARPSMVRASYSGSANRSSVSAASPRRSSWRSPPASPSTSGSHAGAAPSASRFWSRARPAGRERGRAARTAPDRRTGSRAPALGNGRSTTRVSGCDGRDTYTATKARRRLRRRRRLSADLGRDITRRPGMGALTRHRVDAADEQVPARRPARAGCGRRGPGGGGPLPRRRRAATSPLRARGRWQRPGAPKDRRLTAPWSH